MLVFFCVAGHYSNEHRFVAILISRKSTETKKQTLKTEWVSFS